MQNFKLTEEEQMLFKKEVKKKMIDLDLKCEDLVASTGYSESSIRNALIPTSIMSKFMIAALTEKLDINLNEIRRKTNG